MGEKKRGPCWRGTLAMEKDEIIAALPDGKKTSLKYSQEEVRTLQNGNLMFKKMFFVIKSLWIFLSALIRKLSMLWDRKNNLTFKTFKIKCILKNTKAFQDTFLLVIIHLWEGSPGIYIYCFVSRCPIYLYPPFIFITACRGVAWDSRTRR